MEGPDHKASLEPDELKAMVKAIRNVELAIGSGEKTNRVRKEEHVDSKKKYSCKRNIVKGERFSEENLIVKGQVMALVP